MNSYQTALVLLPPRQIAERLNPFRLLHDKSAPRWTAHFTLQFPFVSTEAFPATLPSLEQTVSQIQPFSFRLDSVGKFSLADYDSVHLSTSSESVHTLWQALASTLKYSGRPFKPHLTLGQAQRTSPDAVRFLEQKAQSLLESVSSFEWTVKSVIVLKKDESDGGIMKLCHELFLAGQSITAYEVAPSFPTAHYQEDAWTLQDDAILSPLSSSLSILTYNILHDDAFPFPARLSALVDTIVTADTDIVCLQEVTDESLSLLLHDKKLALLYRYSSRHPDVVCENERNILVLAKLPFTWKKIHVGGKHKPVFLATFFNPSGASLVIAAVHLTAGRAASPLEQKAAELKTLISYLSNNHPNEDWIIAGDTNWPNVKTDTPADELFIDVGLVKPYAATYDPTLNLLAAATVRDAFEPQRYDRVYIKRAGEWSVKQTMVLGDDDPSSDHFALKVVLEQKPPDNPNEPPPSRSSEAALPETVLTTEEMQGLLRRHSFLPSQEQTTTMQNALQTLKQIIAEADAATPMVQIHLEATGSFALGVHTSSSDVDTLAVGNISASAFWALARRRVKASGDVAKLRRFVKNAIVPRMELEVQGVKMDMQYCPAAQLAGVRWKELSKIPPESSLFHLPTSTLVTLNSYRDVLTLRRVIPDLPIFRAAHRALKQYLTVQGLCGARFGFLGGFHLTLLLSRIALTLPHNAGPHHLVRQFFRTYSEWNWERDMVYPIPNREEKGYRRTHKEPIVVLSIEKPLSNLTFHASPHSLRTMVNAFTRAERMFNENKSWEEVCGLSDSPEQTFLSSFKVFIRLDVHYWGNSSLQGRELIGWLESRIVSLLVQLSTAVTDMHARFWPHRFVDGSSDHQELNGFYLFGLSPADSASIMDKETIARKNAIAENALVKCLRSFEDDLHAHEGYHDPSNSTFLALSYVKRANLPERIILDPYSWLDEVEIVDEDEESEESIGESSDQRPEEHTLVSASQRKRALKAKGTAHVPAPSKLRTSSDVFNRLLWDPVASKESYLIGYEDRFLGIKEMALTAWSREVDSESFIPLHRIVYFKRVSDGVVVWDKRSKTDLLFGSGVGGGS